MQLPFQPNNELGRELLSIVPAERISQGVADRLVYSRDGWPKALFSVRDNKPSVYPPDFIVWPEAVEEVANIVRLCAKYAVPLVPFGGGSGVCGGAMAINGGIIMDLKRMNRLVHVSLQNHQACFQTGIIGQALEEQLNLRGLTLGHFPASIYISTLGGWLATRSAGQLSSKYGKIEDMVCDLEAVLGDGRIIRASADHEPNLIPLLLGTEGTLGILTQATLRVQPLADYRLFRAYEFPRVAAGCEAMRRVMQRGLRPAVMRLYDEMDTLMAQPTGERKKKQSLWEGALGLLPKAVDGFHADLKMGLLRAALLRAGILNKVAEKVAPRLSGGCLAILGFEGREAPLVEAEAALAHAEYLAAGGRDLGEELGLSWFENRYAVSYKQSVIYVSGGFVDTMEVATTWDRLLDLYHEVRRALAPLALVLAHFSHVYPQGCSIYFTIAASAAGRMKTETLYDEIWQQGLAAVLKAGGTISHHHGIGVSKAAFMKDELGSAMSIYRQLKAALDPQGILNPGKMGL